MNDSEFGKMDSKGYWKPKQLIRYPDVFVWPLQLRGILKWLPNYLFPWAILYGVFGFLVWHFLTPPVEQMKVFSLDWIALVALRNAVLTTLVVGGQHYWLYVRQSQGTAFKYNKKWPNEKAARFTFGTQLKDNLFWTFCSGVPIWTAWEVSTLWLYANGHIALLDAEQQPILFATIWFFVPLLHEFHFYCVHRLIHSSFLYKRVHKVHHRNINPAPWSGISMHPVEHLLYFSGFLFYWVIPAHPIFFMHYSMMVGLSPAQGHTGFDRVVLNSEQGKSLHLPYYAHYLHHRLFEVNYADGSIPLDKWFGSFHDGSAEADAALKKRRSGMK